MQCLVSSSILHPWLRTAEAARCSVCHTICCRESAARTHSADLPPSSVCRYAFVEYENVEQARAAQVRWAGRCGLGGVAIMCGVNEAHPCCPTPASLKS